MLVLRSPPRWLHVVGPLLSNGSYVAIRARSPQCVDMRHWSLESSTIDSGVDRADGPLSNALTGSKNKPHSWKGRRRARIVRYNERSNISTSET
nr:hypothetical protein CFP56_39018 [Quercus suber]